MPFGGIPLAFSSPVWLQEVFPSNQTPWEQRPQFVLCCSSGIRNCAWSWVGTRNILVEQTVSEWMPPGSLKEREGCYRYTWNGTLVPIWLFGNYRYCLWGLAFALVQIPSLSGSANDQAPLHSAILYFEALPVDKTFLGQRPITGPISTLLSPTLTKVLNGRRWRRVVSFGRYQGWQTCPLLYSLTCGPSTSSISIT